MTTKPLKLKEWAVLMGVHYQTAWKWWHDGNLPVPAFQTPTGAVFVTLDDQASPAGGAALYAQVSSSDQKNDLDARLGGWLRMRHRSASWSCAPQPKSAPGSMVTGPG